MIVACSASQRRESEGPSPGLAEAHDRATPAGPHDGDDDWDLSTPTHQALEALLDERGREAVDSLILQEASGWQTGARSRVLVLPWIENQARMPLLLAGLPIPGEISEELLEDGQRVFQMWQDGAAIAVLDAAISEIPARVSQRAWAKMARYAEGRARVHQAAGQQIRTRAARRIGQVTRVMSFLAGKAADAHRSVRSVINVREGVRWVLEEISQGRL